MDWELGGLYGYEATVLEIVWAGLGDTSQSRWGIGGYRTLTYIKSFVVAECHHPERGIFVSSTSWFQSNLCSKLK